MLLGGIFVMAACSDDRDDNPTIKVPTAFKMDTPSFASSQLDLKKDANLDFSWEKPDFGYSAKVNYTLEVSNSGKFTTSIAQEEDATDDNVKADYAEIPTIFTKNKATITNDDLALAVVQVGHWEKPEQLPATQKVYVRVKAALPNVDSLHSNVVEFDVATKYVELPPKVKECHFTGSEYGWSKWNALVPVYGTIGQKGKIVPTFWKVAYFKADESIKFAPQAGWGHDFAYGGAAITDNAGAGLKPDKDQNIQIGKAGWYLVVVGNNGKSPTVRFEKPYIYLQGATNGGDWTCKAENRFSIPTTADGEFVSPAFVQSGEIRMCVKLDGYDWWHSEFIVDAAGKIDYRGIGNDQARVNGGVGQRCHLNFSTGKGSYK